MPDVVQISEIKGLEDILELLRGMERSQFLREMTQLTDKAVYYVLGHIPDYPPPPMNSSYRRTGTLGRGITGESRQIGSEIVGVIGSNTVYAPKVIGEDTQSKIHRGRWWTLVKVIKDLSDGILKVYSDGIDLILNR